MIKFLSIFAFLLITNRAQARFFIEPHLGYETSTIELRTTNLTSSDIGGEPSGASFGLRFGYRFPVQIWLGGDIEAAQGKVKMTNSAFTSDGDFSRTTGFILLGYDSPFLFRFWLGYGLSDELTLKNDAFSSQLKFTGGSAAKLGVGFPVIPLLAINFEYYQRTLKDVDAGTGKVSSSSVFPDTVKDSGFMASVSMPYQF